MNNMKRFLLLMPFFLFQQYSFSQKIYYNEKNHIQHVWSQSYLKLLDDEIGFSIDNYLTNNTSEYYIYLTALAGKHNRSFPCNSKLVFETFEGSIIELVAVMAEIYPTPDENGVRMALFPITIEQLETLFTGVSLIRMDLLSYDNQSKTVNKEHPEIKFKKDKLGQYLRKAYEGIENGKKRRKMTHNEFG